MCCVFPLVTFPFRGSLNFPLDPVGWSVAPARDHCANRLSLTALTHKITPPLLKAENILQVSVITMITAPPTTRHLSSHLPLPDGRGPETKKSRDASRFSPQPCTFSIWMLLLFIFGEDNRRPGRWVWQQSECEMRQQNAASSRWWQSGQNQRRTAIHRTHQLIRTEKQLKWNKKQNGMGQNEWISRGHPSTK